jgi:photosystem II stability/assembly factor-like uncharacterized protein
MEVLRGLRRTSTAILSMSVTATAVLTVLAGQSLLAGPAEGDAGKATGDAHHPRPAWTLVPTGVTSHFRGLSAIDDDVVWLGGYGGVILRTVDGGRHWQDVSPAGAATLQFRDVEAFDARHAVAMSAGAGADSRLYRTSDGGMSWSLAYQNSASEAFFDCMSFADPDSGYVLSDPVGGKFRVLATTDGGQSWNVLADTRMPSALAGEAGFAASGQCLTARGKDVWFGAGGAAQARVFRSPDRGRSWSVSDTGMSAGPTGGVFAVAFRDSRHGIAIGGDFTTPTSGVRALALTRDGGRRWTQPVNAPSGYRSGATFVPGQHEDVIAVGPSGSDISENGGRTWTQFDTGSFDTVDCTADDVCWASGEAGRVAVLNLNRSDSER